MTAQGLSMEAYLASYQQFWDCYFPECHFLSREAALLSGQQFIPSGQSIPPPESMMRYQDAVAGVYGAYELALFQVETMRQLLSHLPLTGRETLVSLGAGPGSYEIWLAAQHLVKQIVLVDLSEQMLERARQIAADLKVSQIQMICADVAAVELPDASADICLSLNSMHWDIAWKYWVKKALRVTKPGGAIMLSASMYFPKSEIAPDTFSGVAARGMAIEAHSFLLPPSQPVAGKVAQSTRYWVIGKKLSTKALKAKKKR